VLRTRADLLNSKQKTRLRAVFANDAHVQVAIGCSSTKGEMLRAVDGRPDRSADLLRLRMVERVRQSEGICQAHRVGTPRSMTSSFATSLPTP
jgi:hypothetical protein